MVQKYTSYKKSADYSYTQGIFPTLELLEARPEAAEVVFFAPNSYHSQGIQKILKLCNQHNIPFTEAAKVISRLSHNDSSFVIGVFKKFSSQLEASAPHVVLIHPDDAGNLGTIIRTMLGFDHHDLAIISPAADIFGPKTIRASMGAIFKLRITYFNSIADYTEHSSKGRHLYPFMLNSTATLATTTLLAPYSLVFGNEGSGLSPDYATLGTPVRIEQSNEIDSLNLAVSVSVALYKAYTSK